MQYVGEVRAGWNVAAAAAACVSHFVVVIVFCSQCRQCLGVVIVIQSENV